VKHSIGTYIKHLRAESSMSQKDLSKLLKHTDASRLCRMEQDKELVPLKAYPTLIRELDADINTLESLFLELKRRKFREVVK